MRSMIMKLNLLFAMLASLSVGAAHADEAAKAAKAARIENATFATQFLTAQACGTKANLSPQAIQEKSTAFAFLLALQSTAVPDDLPRHTSALVERMQKMQCGNDGILELRSQF